MGEDTVTVANALSIERIRDRLPGGIVGSRLLLYDAVPSTNAVLREMARGGAPEGTVVLADTQTAGLGRGGKPWFSPPGVNLYASVLLRPAIRPRDAGVFSMIASLAVADGVGEVGLPAAIKWPNDVLVRRRKVAGMLAEVASIGDRVEHLILGIGINVNVDAAALRAALGEAAPAATSLSEELGRPVDRCELAAGVLGALEEWRVVHGEQGGAAILRVWRDLDIVTGRRVAVIEGGMRLEGRARGVDAEGHLEVEDVAGALHRVVAGEVRLLE